MQLTDVVFVSYDVHKTGVGNVLRMLDGEVILEMRTAHCPTDITDGYEVSCLHVYSMYIIHRNVTAV
jgi:hypothetical protein